MSDQGKQLAELDQELWQLFNPRNGDSRTGSREEQSVCGGGFSIDYFGERETRLTALLQNYGIDVEAIKREYKRGLAESKEAYQDILSSKPAEHSKNFQNALSRHISALAIKKAFIRARIFHTTFEAAEKSFGRRAVTDFMDASKADEFYEAAHQKVFPPGYPYHSLEHQEFRYLE